MDLLAKLSLMNDFLRKKKVSIVKNKNVSLLELLNHLK